MRPHERIDQRSLALHEAVALRIEADPSLLGVARNNLTRWLATTPQPALLEWRRLLESAPLTEVLDLLRSPSDRASRMRQSSPFAGVLTAVERNHILALYESRRP